MAKLVKGPFSIQWGSNPILDVSELGFNYDVATNDYETIQGTTYTVEGAITASVEVTLLSSDVASLATIFPQYYVPKGGTLSTGEQVTGDDGAIDIKAAACDSSSSNYNLEITSCNGEVTRLVNARTSLSGVEFADNSVRTITVTFRGEPESGQGIIQFFGENAITPES
jgi:hypothetical protein